jgi:hypothetical protein
MAEITVERCPETGICSIVRDGGSKIDLMPDEADQLLQVRNNSAKLRELLQEVDPAFAQALSDDEVARIGANLRS